MNARMIACSMLLAYAKAEACGVRCYIKYLVESRIHTDDSEHGIYVSGESRIVV